MGDTKTNTYLKAFEEQWYPVLPPGLVFCRFLFLPGG